MFHKPCAKCASKRTMINSKHSKLAGTRQKESSPLKRRRNSARILELTLLHHVTLHHVSGDLKLCTEEKTTENLIQLLISVLYIKQNKRIQNEQITTHARGQGITMKTSEKQAFKAALAPPRGRSKTKKLNYTGNSNFKN